MKRLRCKVTVCLICLFALLPAAKSLAHKVDLYVSAKGDTVYTESYYPDGKKVENGSIEVFDSQGNKLLEGKTDSEGLFSFKIPKKDDLKIVLDAHLGHKTSTFIFVEELEAGVKKKTQETHTHPGGETHTHETDQGKCRAKKEAFPLAAVLGGLGFIFGLTALIMRLTSKKKG